MAPIQHAAEIKGLTFGSELSAQQVQDLANQAIIFERLLGANDLIRVVDEIAIDSHLEIFNFQGFNALEIATAFYTAALKEASKNTAVQQFETSGKADVTSIHHKARILIVKAVAVGIIRGNLHTQGLKRTSEDGQKAISELVTIFSIPMRLNGKDKKPVLEEKTMTFVRAASVFPHYASELLFLGTHNIKGVMMKEFTSNEYGPLDDYPRAMAHMAFYSCTGGLIPFKKPGEKPADYISRSQVFVETRQHVQRAACVFIELFLKTITDPSKVTIEVLDKNINTLAPSKLFTPENSLVMLQKWEIIKLVDDKPQPTDIVKKWSAAFVNKHDLNKTK